jgi:hypothetical protein
MTYTIDSNSCVKGGSYTLTMAYGWNGYLTLSSYSPVATSSSWINTNFQKQNEQLQLNDPIPAITITNLLVSNGIDKNWCTT